MSAAVYYAKEREVFSDAYTRFVSDESARYIVRHFARKLGVQVELKFRGRVQRGFYNIRHVLCIHHEPSLGVIAHELAHAVQHQKRNILVDGRRWHGDEHWAIMQGIIADMRADAWKIVSVALWAEEAKKERRAARAAAHDPRAELIERRRAQVKRLERKIKALTTRLKTAKRSLAGLERVASKATRR